MKEDLKIIATGTIGALAVYGWIYLMFSLSSVH